MNRLQAIVCCKQCGTILPRELEKQIEFKSAFDDSYASN